MRRMFGTLILGTLLATAAIAGHGNGLGDLGLPPLQPMGGAVAFAAGDEPDIQPAPQPSWVRQLDHDNGSEP